MSSSRSQSWILDKNHKPNFPQFHDRPFSMGNHSRKGLSDCDGCNGHIFHNDFLYLQSCNVSKTLCAPKSDSISINAFGDFVWMGNKSMFYSEMPKNWNMRAKSTHKAVISIVEFGLSPEKWKITFCSLLLLYGWKVTGWYEWYLKKGFKKGKGRARDKTLPFIWGKELGGGNTRSQKHSCSLNTISAKNWIILSLYFLGSFW